MMTPNSAHEKDASANLTIADTEPLRTVEELAKFLRVKAETVRMMARSQRIPAIKVGKSWRFRDSEIKEWLQSKPDVRNSRTK